jgi:hypothetical protein
MNSTPASSSASRIAMTVRWMQRLALFEAEHCVWADAGHHGKVLHTDPEGSARHLALCRVQICWLHPDLPLACDNVRRIHQ